MSDLDANHYRKHSSFQYQAVKEILDVIKIHGDETILDIGCGDGRITADLAIQIPEGKIIGIDPSPSMIELALSSFPKKAFPNMTFRKASAENFHFDPCSVDIILMMNVLHWIRDPQKSFQNAFDALKPEGSFFILAYPKESCYWQFLEKTLKEDAWQSYEEKSVSKSILASQEYRQLLERLGFIMDTWFLIKEIAIYNTAKELHDYVKGWLNCFISMPPTQEEAFLDRSVENAATQFFDVNSQAIRIPYSKLVVKATKKHR